MAGRYIAKSDIEDLFGVQNVIVWSDLDNNDAVDNPRIERAIAYAEDRINDKFRGYRYAIPFQFRSGTSKVLIHWASAIAGMWLYQSRGLRDEEGGERLIVLVEGDPDRGITGVEGDIRKYLAGQERFDAAQVDTQPSAPQVVM